MSRIERVAGNLYRFALSANNRAIAYSFGQEGWYAENNGNDLMALKAYRLALYYDEYFAEIWVNIASLLYRRKKWTGARACYRRALSIDSDFALAHFGMGNTLDEKGLPEEAIKHYLEVVRIVPSFADAHYNLGLMYVKTKCARGAIRHFRLYVQHSQESIECWRAHARQEIARLQLQDLSVVNVDSSSGVMERVSSRIGTKP